VTTCFPIAFNSAASGQQWCPNLNGTGAGSQKKKITRKRERNFALSTCIKIEGPRAEAASIKEVNRFTCRSKMNKGGGSQRESGKRVQELKKSVK